MNTKEKYLSFAEYAASLEKSGYYAEAIDEWEKAYSYARGENVPWCQARINRCKKAGRLFTR
ncbi:ANR family transcriptional regulator [Escherichia coli]|uniref:ANR family transcriptional regulator n=1 Tax=Escherichia coli TaxID=562 RepID=UPI000E208701|nr:ANR family transcriptional regulator [Escherichia coli]EFC5375833.1 ANR family transcriptional regulator [Escherichia coli]EFH9364267.1 ANR family transcriptional regulator [Escherichia coli]EJV7210474.1 ANR family transcriptional regulator [Escherichia coli]MCG3993374.1 ANR family transcriptional regulator [Escherichia coli]MCN5159798.1 ANR family transcriptional regulator [Escherichia coli]